MNGTWRLAAAVLAVAAFGGLAAGEDIVFPDDAGVVSVKQFGAVGDGKADDTAAIQKAVDTVKGIPDTLYFPNGTYLISDGVGIFGGKAHSRDRFLTWQGQSEAGTVIRLKDRCPGFGDASKPKVAVSVYKGQGTGDTMHGYVRNLTVDVGRGNPGAVGLRFMSNNTGGVYHVTVRSSDPAGAGVLGLDMTQGQNGPNLVKHVTVVGFDYGVRTNDTFALVFEHLTLRRQRVLGFLNHNARTSMRGLVSENRVPALKLNKNAHMTLIEATLTGGSADAAAIVTESRKFFGRDIRASGYGNVLRDAEGKAHGEGELAEWYAGKAHSPFGCELKSLRLPIEETPEVPWESDLSKWQKVDWPADGDDSAALQAALDAAAEAGKTTVYIPRLAGKRRYPRFTSPVRVHGSVRRVIGMSNIADVADPEGKFKAGAALFTFDELTCEAVAVERFFLLGGWKCPAYAVMFANGSDRPVVIRNVNHAGVHKKPCPGGRWFIEDVSPSRTGTLKIGKGERLWARQLNPESPEKDMIHVDGGQLWVLGLKTEGRSRHIVATGGAKVELLGGVSYQSWKNQKLDPPMFTLVDSDASLTFGFYHWNQPFTTIVHETRSGETRELPRKHLQHYHLPLYRACGGR